MKDLSGHIVLVDDAQHEKHLFELALKTKEWNAPIDYFSNAEDAFNYLKSTSSNIFLIVSDINMPKMDGFEFKKQLDNDPVLSLKAIPFIFITNSAAPDQVAEAYKLRIQGYFEKPLNVDAQADIMDAVIRYWLKSKQPRQIATLLQLPGKTQVHETSVGTMWFDDEGILHSISKNTPRTLENMKAQYALIESMVNGKKVCLIVDVSFAGPIDDEARSYIKEVSPKYFKAMALVSNSVMGRLFGTIILMIISTDVPTQIFSNETKAKEWLRNFL